MNLLQRLQRQPAKADQEISFDRWLSYFTYNGLGYPVANINQTYGTGGKTREIVPYYSGLASAVIDGNGIVWACVTTRNVLFSEAPFKFRRKGQIGSSSLYGTQDLLPLEVPWPGGTSRKLLRLLDLYTQLAGNGYAYRDPTVENTIRVLNPDWVTIVLGSRKPRPTFIVGDPDTEIIGYSYRPNGDADREVPILPEQMAHFMPNPDPVYPFKGASWLRPVLREIMADGAATEHKLKFFENAATPNMVVTLDPNIRKEEFDAWVDRFDAGHKSAVNAYKTIYLAGGADAKVVGADLRQMDFKAVQAHDEVRVCNAAGIPPILVGVSEGLDSATYSNYGMALRAWANTRVRPMWADICSELAKLVSVPGGSELWYDERQIGFLAEDLKDQAAIQQTQAATIKSLIDAGWTPESAAVYMETGDLTQLIHTGLYSVQLQPPGIPAPTPTATTPPPEPAQPPSAAAFDGPVKDLLTPSPRSLALVNGNGHLK